MVGEAVLSVVVFLSPLMGGTIRAHDLTFETPALCERFVRELRSYSVRHQILRDCAPAPAGTAPLPKEPLASPVPPDRGPAPSAAQQEDSP